jgi:ABC-2 type transport system permease protein
MHIRVWFRVHWRMFVAGWRRGSRYRAAALGGLVANATFGFLKASILVAAVHASGGEVGGYDAASIIAYTWLSQALLGSVNLSGRSDLATRMKDGSIAVDLLRPVDLQTATSAQEVGRALFALLPRGVPLVLLGELLGGMRLPLDPVTIGLGLFSVVAGTTLSFLAAYLVAIAGFWSVETRGIQTAYMVVSGFLAGLFIPVTLFPGWLLAVARATPFPCMLQTSIDVLSGHLTGFSAVQAVTVQLTWIAGVLLVGQLITRAGRHRLEVQGG